ncbi:DUF11 domain-containing protein [Deinococcus sp. HMF7620]|uniref:DUF11 domain-containing protein n=1 Tax=Deinococcus arboris TaxID=2682977 RepID=A0A7C9MRC7_9DEIO|nr:DUF11 domain-containing protein [Deinococcus arboris]MVN87064.1 DUF11 domain-containing protein [Deinococcus arboris]
MKRSPFLSATLALTGLLSAAAPALAATPAGTEIVNQATAEYVPPVPEDRGLATSNVVRTVVQAVCSVSVTPDGTVAQPGQRADLLPGERAVFTYSVVNTGNTTGEFPVLARFEQASTLTPPARVVRDLNGNGQPDAAEPDVTSVALAPDERAALLLVVETSPAADAQGDAYANLVASCAGGESTDSNNVSLVRVGPPPVLGVQKTFSPSLVRPGSETTVTVTSRNSGQGESREVVLTDLLADQIALGLVFVPGSARTNVGLLEYTTDGTTWTEQEVQPVRGVRVRVERLAPNAAITLTFRMLATGQAEGRVIPNTATARTSGREVSGSASADVRYLPAVAIGPVGNPEAPEGSAADAQQKPFAVVGQLVCFDHTAKNTGDVRDNFRLTVTYPQGAARAEVQGENGQPLVQPLVLEPGQTAFVRVCYDAQQAGPMDALVTITGDRGESNATRDQIAAVEAGLPELRKSYVATTQGTGGQVVTVPDGGTVAAGDTITYTLTMRNPYARPLTNAVVSDPIPAHVDFKEASAGGVVSGQPGAQTVTWALGTLQPGEARTLTVTTQVSTRAVDGEALRNVFNLVTTELTAPLPSNEVLTPVWTAQLLIRKDVSAQEAGFGDRLTYTLNITNASATTAIVNAVITDTPARGLEYIPGTSLLNGQPLADPTIEGGVLRWSVAELPAGRTVTIAYQTRVTPEATGQLVNTVQVSGTGAGGVARAIASNRATAVTKLNPLKFAPLADLLGTVFVDRNRNGLFDPLLDTPVQGARVLLAGGRQVLTDVSGRYSFPNVAYGTQALRLDPASAPYPPLHVPQDGGLSGTQTVFVRGLTSVDFPLAPLGGDIDALRRTVLLVGDVRVEKAVYVVEGGYVVTLRVVSPRALEAVSLLDPLPDGAVLKEGRNTYSGNLAAGELNLTYRFDWTGEPRAATTDPSLSWRY